MTQQITIPLATMEQLVGALEVLSNLDADINFLNTNKLKEMVEEALTAGRAAIDSAELAEPMIEVADRYAHRLALELECVLADRHGYYNTAMQVLGEYREAMNAIHERHSPTFMGEPLLPKGRP